MALRSLALRYSLSKGSSLVTNFSFDVVSTTFKLDSPQTLHRGCGGTIGEFGFLMSKANPVRVVTVYFDRKMKGRL
jgi:hypothetical protein